MDSFDPIEAMADAEKRLEHIRSQARANAERGRALSRAVETVRKTVSSPRKEVAVTAGVGGKIDQVRFGQAAQDLDLNTLSNLTTQTIRNAQHAAMEELAQQTKDLFGADSEVAAQAREDAERAFPDPGITFT